jgi:hypothetical protein
MKQLIRVTSKYFCAGAIVENSIVIHAAPIIKWMINKNIKNIYADNKHKFDFERVGNPY